MFAFLIFIILVLGIIVLISLFSPQSLPWYRPHLILSKSEITPIPEPQVVAKPVIIEQQISTDIEFETSLREKVSRLELILGEKNKILEKLQKELTAEKEHRFEFGKVQLLLEKEIEDLKAKNRKLKSQIGESDA